MIKEKQNAIILEHVKFEMAIRFANRKSRSAGIWRPGKDEQGDWD